MPGRAAAGRVSATREGGQVALPDIGVIGAGVGKRLRQVRTALERYDAFVFGPGNPAASPGPAEPGAPGHAQPGPAYPPGEGRDAARALVLRALRACADPLGWQVMERLAAGDASTGDLAAVLGCPRLVAWEQVNDLVQAGLAARAPDGDVVGLTPAGQELAALVETLAQAALEERGTG